MGAGVMPIGALGRPPQGGTCHSVSSTQRGFRLYSSPPLHQLSSESRHCGVSLDCLISRIIHHLERSWPPWGDPGPTSRRAYCFSAKLTGSQTCRH